ncbi:MAG: oxygen-dependent coproporphyrinogen oxidase [Gammaproteobacteria bacterium]|nr:oxygen-dependent coproporphyrinogen oxidase [Gammaproteobacteria bacterium]
MLHVNDIKHYFSNLQQTICLALEKVECEKTFQKFPWQHTGIVRGEGRTAVLEGGKCIEKGGVNVSHVFGDALPPSSTEGLRRPTGDQAFQALGISLILHPENPYVPTVHMNLRFFKEENSDSPLWWFGGGMDLTPCYGFEEDARHWHQTLQTVCAPFGSEVYPTFKKNCDDYFYLKHRKEPRGIGGIFFDDLNEWGFENCFAFTKHVGDCFLSAYLPIVNRRSRLPFGKRGKQFQAFRRGRYVEFNLIIDRGTLFGLQTEGRTESILMSLPPTAEWRYNWHPEPNSPEAALEAFLKPRDWV